MGSNGQSSGRGRAGGSGSAQTTARVSQGQRTNDLMSQIRGTTSARRFLEYVEANTGEYDREDVVDYFRTALSYDVTPEYQERIFHDRDTAQRDIIDEHMTELERRLARPSRRF